MYTAPPIPVETRYTLFHWVAEGWDAIVNDVTSANESVVMEQYIIDDGQFVRRLFDVLCEKARQGVNVRVLCDSLGSTELKKSSLPQQLRSAGGDVRFYTPSWLRRDHRKAVVVDGRCAFVGGLCFADWMERWRDDTLKITGPLVEQVKREFDEAWTHASGEAASGNRSPGAQMNGNEYVVNKLKRPQRRRLYTRLLSRVRRARSSIRLTTPYLSPSPRMLLAIGRAARRGVRVDLLLPCRSDNRFADWVSRLTARYLARQGVRVHAFEGAVLHAKSAVVDRRWVLVGSLNLDLLSLRFNLENGVVSTDASLVDAVDRQFDADLAFTATARVERSPCAA